VVDAKTLVKQFGSEPGLAFLEIIRAAPNAIGATGIKRQLVDAGAKQVDVDRYWKRLQPALKLHPQVRMGSNKYEWSAVHGSAKASLEVLASNLLAKLPGWLAQALVQNVARDLAEKGSAESTWADKEFDKARLVADLAVAVEALRVGGGTIAEVNKLFAEETQRKRLWPIGRPGDSVAFDPASHEAEAPWPRAGTTVLVVRSGYMWRGGGEPIVAAKAVVTL
jgi:hypothetical protein